MSRLRTGGSLAAALLSLTVPALLAGCGGSSQPAKPLDQLPAGQILATTLAAARSAGSMYYTEYAGTVSSSTANLVVTGDALPASGYQLARAINGATMTEVVGPGGTYVEGNPAAMTDFIGIPAATATQLASRWLILKPGDPTYKQTTEGVTETSVLSLYTPVGKITKAKKLTKVGGQSVIVLYGLAPASSGMGKGATATFYVAATGKPLPVAADEIGTNGDDNELLFTRASWGKKVTNAAAPARAVPYPAG